jgi:hypothetical protein
MPNILHAISFFILQRARATILALQGNPNLVNITLPLLEAVYGSCAVVWSHPYSAQGFSYL